MRARALRRGSGSSLRRAGCARADGERERASASKGPASPARSGREADRRLRELAALRRAARPVLGALALRLVEGRLHESLGYRCLGDYAREHLGVGARSVREWARVWRALAELPRLRGAVLSGEVGWAVARRVVALVTPETEGACLASVRGRTVRAVEAMVRAVREADARPSGSAGASAVAEDQCEERVRVRLACSEAERELWWSALELARRVAGEELPAWACAEAIAAEAASAFGVGDGRDVDAEPTVRPGGAGDGDESVAGSGESGLRERAFTRVSWRTARATLPRRLLRLVEGIERCSARELDRRLRSAIAFLQSVDFDAGHLLRRMVDRRLFAEIGFGGLARYAQERLDVSPRTARRLVALARMQGRAPALAIAFRRGAIHALQARALARVADPESTAGWIARARAVSYRRLVEETQVRASGEIDFRAPPDVAALFLTMLRRVGSLTRLLAHAIRTWLQHGARFRDYADFGRDGYRCRVPGCTARRGLESHHRWYRSRGGPDVAWNRVTLCHAHHRRGVHAGNLAIHGRAPDGLIFELGRDRAERFASGDLRLPGKAFSPA